MDTLAVYTKFVATKLNVSNQMGRLIMDIKDVGHWIYQNFFNLGILFYR